MGLSYRMEHRINYTKWNYYYSFTDTFMLKYAKKSKQLAELDKNIDLCAMENKLLLKNRDVANTNSTYWLTLNFRHTNLDSFFFNKYIK
jgi:hypothetical protein